LDTKIRGEKMDDIIIYVNTKKGLAYKDYKGSVAIGNQNQNLQNKLKFELSEMINGEAWLEYEIDGVKRQALMDEYEKGYQIDIKSCLLVSEHVTVNIKITEEKNPDAIPIFVSTTVTYTVNKTVGAEEEEPEEYPSWFESANAKLVELDNAEKVRNDNETSRINAETSRNENESKREEYIDELKKKVDKGELNGSKGETGETPNLKVGEVNTLPAGENATVTITGTKEEPIINISIPRGEKGEIKMVIVDELPEIGEDGTIYYVPKEEATSDDKYDEYTYINNKFEYVGSKTIKIDLSNYYNKEETDSQISNSLTGYVKKTDYGINGVGVVEILKSTTDQLRIYGLNIGSKGIVYIQPASNSWILEKLSSTKAPITPANLDYAVKVGLTTNTETLTDEEKQSAQNWLGITDLVGNVDTLLADLDTGVGV
jgi:hypothetical protein